MSNSLWPQGLLQTRLPCPLPTPRACSNSWSSSQWPHPTISSSVGPFSFCLQSFPASGSFQWVTSSHQVAKVLELQLQHQSCQWIFRLISPANEYSGSSVLPMNIQAWLPLGLTGLISLLFKGLLKVFSNSTVQKYCSSVLSYCCCCCCFLMFQLSHPNMTTGKAICLTTWACFTITNREIDSNFEESLGANWVVPLLLHDLTVQTLWPFITIFYIYCWLTR